MNAGPLFILLIFPSPKMKGGDTMTIGEVLVLTLTVVGGTSFVMGCIFIGSYAILGVCEKIFKIEER